MKETSPAVAIVGATGHTARFMVEEYHASRPRRAAQVLAWKPQYSDLDSVVQSAWKWHAKGRTQGPGVRS